MTTVTSKGQVTIPKRIRDALGIKPGSEVEVEYSDHGNAVIRPVRKKVGQSAFRKRLERVRGTLDLGGMSTDEYMKWLRGDD